MLSMKVLRYKEEVKSTTHQVQVQSMSNEKSAAHIAAKVVKS